MAGTEQRAGPSLEHAAGETWTVLRLMEWSGRYLVDKGIEKGRLDAEHLLAHAMGVERLQLYLQYDRPLVDAELDRYRPLLRRRARREPLQYILGRAAFRHLDLSVDSAVLIPRPETEVLLDEVLDWAAREARDPLSALDIGTGSGAIALALAQEGPFTRVVATDTSAAALETARRNAEEVGLAERIDFREGAYFAPLEKGEAFDVIVSNPPYVAEGEMASLDPEVREWEPSAALVAGPDGLEALRRIVAGSDAHLGPEGLLALEVGLEQAGAVVQLVESTGRYTEVRVRRDLTGRERIVLARRTTTNQGSSPTRRGL